MSLIYLYMIRGGLKDEFVHNGGRCKVFNLFHLFLIKEKFILTHQKDGMPSRGTWTSSRNGPV